MNNLSRQQQSVRAVSEAPRAEGVADYLIHRAGEEVIVRSAYSRDVVTRCTEAAEAFDEVLARLQEQGGGAVTVGSGTYVIDHPIRVPSLVTVRGSGRATVLKPGESNEEGIVFLVEQAEAVALADLTCQGRADAQAGIALDDCGDCVVQGVHARDFGGYGILLRNECFMNKLLHNTTSGNGRAGTYLGQSASGRGGEGRGGDWVPNLVVGGTSIGEGGHGFELDQSFCTNLVGCQAYQPAGHGFYIHAGANSTCITGARVYQGLQNGVLVEDSHEINLSSSILGWQRGHGVELEHVVWGTVSANNFIDNGGRVESQTSGIYLHAGCKSLQITGNALFNWPGHLPMQHGIYEAEDCTNNQITDNNIHYVAKEAVVVRGTGSMTANNLAYAGTYGHPDVDDMPELDAPFTTERVERFLALTRK